MWPPVVLELPDHRSLSKPVLDAYHIRSLAVTNDRQGTAFLLASGVADLIPPREPTTDYPPKIAETQSKTAQQVAAKLPTKQISLVKVSARRCTTPSSLTSVNAPHNSDATTTDAACGTATVCQRARQNGRAQGKPKLTRACNGSSAPVLLRVAIHDK
jgi:hypothetical protein